MDRFCAASKDVGWLVECEQTCFGCPSTWDGSVSINGEKHDIYIRLRHGVIRVVVDTDIILTESVGGGIDGIISWDEVKPFLAMAMHGHRD